MNYLNYVPYAARMLMGGIDDPVRRGAPFSWAAEFTDWWLDTSFRDLPEVMTAIQNKVAGSGNTQNLVRVYHLAGGLNPFVVVEGYAGREFSNAYLLRDAISGIAASEYSGVNFGTVRFEVTTYNPATGQQQQSRVDTPLGSGPPAPPGSQTGLFDSIATALSVPKDEAQMLVFGGAALLLLMVMKR